MAVDKSFTFWENMKTVIDGFEGFPDTQLKLYDAITEYGLYGIMPEPDGTRETANIIGIVQGMVPSLDNSRNFNQKQSEKGVRGGSARKVEVDEIEGAIKSAAARLGKIPTREQVVAEIEELLGKKISTKTITRNVPNDRLKELAEEILGTKGQIDVPKDIGTKQDISNVPEGQIMSHFNF